MSMIKCPECGIQVSDKAERCPKCAYPISNSSAGEKVQMIEQTSKKLKKQLIFAVITMAIGIIAMMVSVANPSNKVIMTFSGLLMWVGLIWIIVIKSKIWWHHK